MNAHRIAPSPEGAELAQIRRALEAPPRHPPFALLLGAAALLAVSACLLAGAVILGPFWRLDNPSEAAFARAHPHP